MRPDRRRGGRRRIYGRRSSDIWGSIGKTAGLLASVTGALIGQAELVGEPWRHLMSGVFIASTAAFGFLLGPQHIKTMRNVMRKRS